MANRTRNIPVKFMVTEEEKKIILAKMTQSKTENMGAYLRKMTIDGYVIKIDYSALKKHTLELNKIGVNINQIAKRLNQTNRVFYQDIREIKKMMDEIWKLQKSILSK
ncbi:plasmid mobilization relaxosome protein MobC [Enterococcus plantarum]|uniref:Plasmid mobilization relaxosome protein MobC n=1 Tax=Enterococcus plantarum TaxID=1077675 RepID=A0A2W4BHQ5_9ENTE|nr:MobC family plasmid mobilization relaxosome protein [Enterococcus plantarum]PZL71739.1 plasmid mobilization relaxosome protein MobC [Enterococcus plantarum]